MKSFLHNAVLIALMAMLLSCGNTSKSNTGGIAFKLTWESPHQAIVKKKTAPHFASASDICLDFGIATISQRVQNSSGSTVATGQFACSAHSGVINGVPAGGNYTLIIEGVLPDSSIGWTGTQTGLSVTASQTTPSVTVSMVYQGADTTPPSVVSMNPTNSSINVPITSPITATFSEDMAASTLNELTFTLLKQGSSPVAGTVSYTSSNKTAVFTPSANLDYAIIYVAAVSTNAKDMANFSIASDVSWIFTTESAPASAPAAPTGVSAAAADKQATITWSVVNGATSYNIYWSHTSGVTKSNGTKLAGVTSPYTHTGLTNGSTYYYVVTAVNSIGESTESIQVSGAIPSSSTKAITAFSLFGVSGVINEAAKTIAVTVPNGTNVTALAATFTITGANVKVGSTLQVSGTTMNNFTNPVTYTLTAADNTTVSYTITVSVAADTAAPSTPTGLLATAASMTQINLSWTASTDNVAVAGYKVYRDGVYLKSVLGSPTTDAGRLPNTNYCYTVSAIDAMNNESAQCAQQCDTTFSDTTAPSVPSGFTATAASLTQIDLSWSASTDDIAVAGYKIYRDGAYLTTRTSTTASDTGLSVTIYCYTVSAIDAAGNESAQCTQSCATPQFVYHMPDTNQIVSYTSTFGEDADYIIYPPSYTDNRDGTVTDNVTGYMWQQQDDAVTRTWTDAGTYCDGLTLAGYSDWWLPNRIELVSLLDLGTYNPAITSTYFPNTQSSYYWSSTTNAGSAWYVHFYGGDAYYSNKTKYYYVRCVRSGQ